MLKQSAASKTDSKVVLVLFHNDLRIHDNATLNQAVQLTIAADSTSGNDHYTDHKANNHKNNNRDDNKNYLNGRLLLVYAPNLARDVNQKDWGQAYDVAEMGASRQAFLVQSIADLDKSLQSLGNRLLYIEDTEQLYQLIETQEVTDICISHTADYAQNLAYDRLQDKYPQIAWHKQSTATLFAAMPTKDLPKSFTQFRKKVEYSHDLLHADSDLATCQAPKTLPPMPEMMPKTMLKERSDAHLQSTRLQRGAKFSATPLSVSAKQVDQQAHRHTDAKMKETAIKETGFQGGESSALAHVEDYFNSEAPSTYKITRNALDTWAHSTKFSPWLANGSLSVKTLLNRLRRYERERIANDSTYWIWFELLWREYFYWYAVTHQQRLFLFQGIQSQPPPTRSDYDQKRLEQWQKGETAYPIVNACMRQLNYTGYMSNRGRQLVASAFVHELGLDWRYGATYFEQQLIDYDVASNWGNWQYLAGVGADPRGCRQFNLKKQTQQHDPEGDFIKKWG